MRTENLQLQNKSPILGLSYNSGLKILAVAQMGDSKDHAVLSLLNLTGDRSIDVIEKKSERNVWAVCFDYREKYLVYSDGDQIFMHDIATQKKKQFKEGNKNIKRIVSSKTSPRIIISGKYVEVLDIDLGHSIWLYKDYDSEEQIKNLNLEGIPIEWYDSKGHFDFANENASIEITREGDFAFISGHNKGSVEQFDISSGKIVNTIFPAPVQAYLMSLGCNDKILAISSKIPYANFVWDIPSGKRIAPEIFNERFGGYSTLVIHSKDRLMLSGSLAGFVSLQNLDDGNFVFSERLHDGRVNQVVFGENSKSFFTGGEDGKLHWIELE